VDLISLAIVTGGLLLYSLISGLSVAIVDAEHSTLHIIAEFTLILVLFTDATLPLRGGHAPSNHESLSGLTGDLWTRSLRDE